MQGAPGSPVLVVLAVGRQGAAPEVPEVLYPEVPEVRGTVAQVRRTPWASTVRTPRCSI
jgi:hypothetical protein